MKHPIQMTLVLMGMFLLTQLIGLIVVNTYNPGKTIIVDGEEKNVTIPFNLEPPKEVKAEFIPWNIIIAMFFAILIVFLLTKIKAIFIFKLWFFFVVVIALAVSIYAFILRVPYSQIIALILAIPLAFYKIFKRNIIVHNLTELFIYPGIASILVPFLSVFSGAILLILISVYDIYAVWHSGFMQKMAQFQIKHLKIFAGFFVPYLNKKQRAELKKIKIKEKKARMKISVAILGGGDVVFPIIMAGVVLRSLGPFSAFMVSFGSVLGLLSLLVISKKDKFYPAMPFISAGIFVCLLLSLIL